MVAHHWFTTSAPSGEVPSISVRFVEATRVADGPISVVYAYVCRHFQVSCLTDPPAEEAAGIKSILSSIAHFITDRKSETLYTGLPSIVTDIWSRLGEVHELTALHTPITECPVESNIL